MSVGRGTIVAVTWLILCVAVLVVAGTAALIVGGQHGAMGELTSSRAHVPLPPDPTDADLDALVLDRGLRGYRMDEVDGVIDTLRAQLAARGARIAELEGGGQADEAPPAGDPAAVDGSAPPA